MLIFRILFFFLFICVNAHGITKSNYIYDSHSHTSQFETGVKFNLRLSISHSAAKLNSADPFPWQNQIPKLKQQFTSDEWNNSVLGKNQKIHSIDFGVLAIFINLKLPSFSISYPFHGFT